METMGDKLARKRTVDCCGELAASVVDKTEKTDHG